MILYRSTNQNTPRVGFKEALFQGQAPDKGLYMPSEFPRFTDGEFLEMKDLPYHEIAFRVLNKFLKGEVDEAFLHSAVQRVYNFEVPLEEVYENTFILRLDRGPTASFKDFAAQMMAPLMHHLFGSRDRLTILTATSGDTGGAVARAFHNLSGATAVVLFPKKEVSVIQRKQMTTLGGDVKVLVVDGKFDDCQAMVKGAFSDRDLAHLNLTTANSINIGRLLPQIVYYFYASARLADKIAGAPLVFSVPSGNFGNLTAGRIAKMMGAPINKFVAAVNANDEVPRFFESGVYKPMRPSRECISSAMNVGHPSNFARIVDIYDGHLNELGEIKIMPRLNWLKSEISAVSVSDDATRGAMKEAYASYGLIMEPHTAVAYGGLKDFRLKNPGKNCGIFLSTAHPAKFPLEIEKVLGLKPDNPPALRDLENLPEYYSEIKPIAEDLKSFLLKI